MVTFGKFYRAIGAALVLVFAVSCLDCPGAWAHEVVVAPMPVPGTMVQVSAGYSPAQLKGIVIHPDNALQFDFVISRGDSPLSQGQKQDEYTKLAKYFLASLAVPDTHQWVNLSPYENKRIIESDFGRTQMGRDLLAQDYLLKQITSSLIYPEQGLGKRFWRRVYSEAYKRTGNTNIAVKTINKVWIVPDHAVIYEKDNGAYVLKNHLKVMLEEDYLALRKNGASPRHSIASKVLRGIIIPALEKEVNEGRNFALLRQVYSGMLLAAWYKRALRESLLAKVYADKDKVKGVDQDDPRANEAIYRRYLQAFKKGVYNYIKEDTDAYTQRIVPRKYFSGGTIGFGRDYAQIVRTVRELDPGQLGQMRGIGAGADMATIALKEEKGAGGMRHLLDHLEDFKSAVDEILGAPVSVVQSRGGQISVALPNNLNYVFDKRTQRPINAKARQLAQSNKIQVIYRDSKNVLILESAELAEALGLAPQKKFPRPLVWALVAAGSISFLAVVGVLWGLQSERSGTEDRLYEYFQTLSNQNFDAHIVWGDEEIGRIETVLVNKDFSPGLKRYAAHLLVRKAANGDVPADKLNKIILISRPRNPQDVTKILIEGAAGLKPKKSSALTPGGIDLNAQNLDLRIKRDGKGVPLPLAFQDPAALSRIEGFSPRIIEIKPAAQLPVFNQPGSL